MIDSFAFLHPVFLLLIPTFVVVSIYFKNRQSTLYMPHFSQWIQEEKRSKRYLHTILKYLIFVSASVALSTPVIIKTVPSAKDRGIDIVLDLDVSGSMSMIGFNEKRYEQSRWSVVKDVVKEFGLRREHDTIGTVIFADKPAIVSPLSYDSKTQFEIIESIKIGVIGRSTALIDSIVTSIEILKRGQSDSKVIILLTDGDDTASKVPLTVALNLAKKYHIKIYTVSIGESRSDILELVAVKSKGRSFVATNKDDLTQVYEKINLLEKSEQKSKTIKVTEQIYFYFLAFSIFCALLFLLFQKDRGDF